MCASLQTAQHHSYAEGPQQTTERALASCHNPDIHWLEMRGAHQHVLYSLWGTNKGVMPGLAYLKLPARLQGISPQPTQLGTEPCASTDCQSRQTEMRELSDQSLEANQVCLA